MAASSKFLSIASKLRFRTRGKNVVGKICTSLVGGICRRGRSNGNNEAIVVWAVDTWRRWRHTVPDEAHDLEPRARGLTTMEVVVVPRDSRGGKRKRRLRTWYTRSVYFWIELSGYAIRHDRSFRSVNLPFADISTLDWLVPAWWRGIFRERFNSALIRCDDERLRKSLLFVFKRRF